MDKFDARGGAARMGGRAAHDAGYMILTTPQTGRLAVRYQPCGTWALAWQYDGPGEEGEYVQGLDLDRQEPDWQCERRRWPTGPSWSGWRPYPTAARARAEADAYRAEVEAEAQFWAQMRPAERAAALALQQDDEDTAWAAVAGFLDLYAELGGDRPPCLDRSWAERHFAQRFGEASYERRMVGRPHT